MLSVRDKLYPFFQYWLALGLFLQLAGVCFVTDGSRYTAIANLMLFLPALLAGVLLWPRINAWQRPLTVVFGALLAWMLVVALFNEGTDGEPLRWLRIALYAWLYVLAISLVMQNRWLWHRLLVAVVLVAAFCAWASLFQAFYVEQRGLAFRAFRLSAWEVGGMADFGNAIVAALYYGVIALVTACLAMQATGVRRGLYLFALVGLLIFQYFTYSRGVWSGVLIGLATLCCFTLSRRAIAIAAVVASPIAVFVLYLLSTVNGLKMSFRDAIFANWWAHIGEFWLWGAGAGADANICIREAKRCFNQAHNLYLQFFFEYGLPGLLLLLTLVGLLVSNSWRYRLQDRMAQLGLALMAFTLVVAVANFYVIFLRPGVFWMVFWLPVGIMLAVSAVPRRGASVPE